DADGAVFGVGAMGSMSIWQLARRGVSVFGFEQFGVGNDRSAAGGQSRLLLTAYMQGQESVPLLEAALLLWKQLEEEANKGLLTLNGGLMIGDPDTTVLRNVLQSIKDFQLDHEINQGSEAKKRYPQHRLFPEDVMILDKNAGYI